MKAETGANHTPAIVPTFSGNPLRQLSPDTDSESEWLAEVERNHRAEQSGSSSDRKRQSEHVPEAEPSAKKRKSKAKAGAGDEDEGGQAVARQFQYRRAPCRLIDIRENEAWLDGCEKLRNAIRTSTSTAVVKRSTMHLKQLTTEDDQWGIVEKQKPGRPGGPCSNCIKRNSECVVKLAEENTSSATGAATYEIISRCLTCILVRGPPCDLVLHSDDDRQKVPSASVEPRPSNSKKGRAEDTPDILDTISAEMTSKPIQAPSKAATKQPRASIPNSKGAETPTVPSRCPPSSAKKGRASLPAIQPAIPSPAESSLSDLPLPQRHYSEADHERVATAVSDITEFHSSIRDMLVERNEMDFRTRSMFRLIEESIQVVKQFTEDHR